MRSAFEIELSKKLDKNVRSTTGIHGKNRANSNWDRAPATANRRRIRNFAGLFPKRRNSDVGYVALQQRDGNDDDDDDDDDEDYDVHQGEDADIELGLDADQNVKRKSNIGLESSGSSSSLEDLFVAATRTSPRRKNRAKIIRNGGTYSMRDTLRRSRPQRSFTTLTR